MPLMILYTLSPKTETGPQEEWQAVEVACLGGGSVELVEEKAKVQSGDP